MKPTPEQEAAAMAQWIKDGTVPEGYMRAVLGDPMQTVTPRPLVRYLTKEEMREMPCPFPPEPGYESSDAV